jgi:hypothetical protein
MPSTEIPSFQYRTFRKFGTQDIFYDQDQEPGNAWTRFSIQDLLRPIPLPRPLTSLPTYTSPIHFPTGACLLQLQTR